MADVTVAEYWDAQAGTFDEEADHGLTDATVRQAWADLLLPRIPSAATVADLGCGTGSLAVLLAQARHRVLGVDVARRMVEAARAKADTRGVRADFVVGDAAAPPWAPGSFDVVLGRHVLWAMPDPEEALREWLRLLRPDGLLLLVEGRWSTGGGLTAAETEELVRRHRSAVTVERLDDSALWGGPITDERYLLISRG
jgi:ubiquinone/menaquinone biosynthesis C-methylase UbiE